MGKEVELHSKSILEDPKTVGMAAKIAHLDTDGKTSAQIVEEVITAGNKIISEYPQAPKNYRTVKGPPYSTPLTMSVAAILWNEVGRLRS